MLKEHERIESLGINGLNIIQSDNEYKFTTDAVLLANFVSNAKGKRVVDIGTGSGIIAILLAGKKYAKAVDAVELQPQLADMATRSVALNNLSDTINIYNDNIQHFATLHRAEYDIAVCNPPYRKIGSGEQQIEQRFALCRHEIALTLQEVLKCGAMMLNAKGSMYVVHQSQRIAEICYLAKQAGLEPKEILPVSPRQDVEPNIVLVRMVKGGNVQCQLHNALVLYDQQGNYTAQAKAYYSLPDDKE